MILGGAPYREIKNITQLAAMVAPTNNAKQYAPYLNMRFGVSRMVMPKTVDAKRANSRTAVKWEGWNTRLVSSRCGDCARRRRPSR